MTFAWPHLLWLLLAPPAWLAWELTHRRRAVATSHPKILQAEAGSRHLQLSSRPVNPGRSRPWLCLGLAFAILAIARPQWGRLEEPVFDQAREILIAVDLSRSMLTPDIRPSRLDRAKLLIQSLLEKLSGERVGLVVFSGTAFLQSPLSADYEILREFLPALNPDFLPEGGTNYRALIDTALAAFGSTAAADRFLIILSDGEATDDDWQERVAELKKKGIRVIGLGIGTAAGAMIPDGEGGFMKDERGAVVLSKLESGTLQSLAGSTDGVYEDGSNWIDVASLISATVEKGQKGKFLEKNTVRLVERFQWPLALAIWCLLVSFYYEFPVRPKPRELRLGPSPDSKSTPPLQSPPPQANPISLLGLLFPLLGALLMTSPTATRAADAPTDPNPPPPLVKIVSRLSSADHRTARDWAELARETVTWGSRLQSSQQPVPEGPIRDALAATDLGSKLDSKTADWPKLQQELEALLKKPDDRKPEPKDQQNQPNQQQKQDQQKQDQSKQDSSQKQDQPPPQPKPEQQPSESSQSKDSASQKEPDEPPAKSGDQEKKESAFGDMKKNEPPPPPSSGETQKVGGVPETKESPETPVDPSLALPLQKLEQLRNQDSPAELFKLMEGDEKPTPRKKTKDW